MSKKLIKMTEDEFYEKYNPIKNHIDLNASFDGCMFETYGEEVDYIQGLIDDGGKQCVWTIIEVEGNFYFVSGWHYVNRFGYLVTEEPVEDDLEIEVKLDTEIDTDIPEANFSEEIVVIDPTSKGEVQLSVFTHPNGGMFAIDSSYLDQEFEEDVNPMIPDPFSKDSNQVIILRGI